MNVFADLGRLLDAEFSASSAVPDPHGDGSLARGLTELRALHRAGAVVPAAALLPAVGRSTRLDQLVALLLDTQPDLDRVAFIRDLRAGLTEPGGGERRTVALLDLATDQRVTPLSLAEAAAIARRSAALHRAVTRYTTVVPRGPDDDVFLDLAATAPDLPARLTWVAAAHFRGHEPETAEKAFPDDPEGVVRFMPQSPPEPRPAGITFLQWFAMWGALDRPGEGDSGGLAVFLTTLGDAVAREDGIGRVLTLANVAAADLVGAGGWLSPHRSEGRPSPSAGDPAESGHGRHHIIGLPCAGPGGTAPPAGDEPLAELSWWLRGLLPALDAVPDVAHLRYGSDVTLAVARTLRRLGTRFVFGIAPDPHRMILDSHHDGAGGIDEPGMREDLHRMFAADLLSTWADSVVAIAGARQPQETPRYFPHVVRRLRTVEAIPEGVTGWRPRDTDPADSRRLLDALFTPAGISGLTRAAAEGSRVLLNVGRWNPLKQQDLLVEAWLRSGLPRGTVLVLVGGSLTAPTPVEAVMRERVSTLLRDAGDAVHGRFAWLPRLANRDVRLLERALAEHLPAAVPHAYVCSSVKEEFGISLLEAMDAGLLVVAPRRGGAGTYVEQGVTGFLTDNTLAAELAADVSMLLGGSVPTDRLAVIATEGQRRARAEFGIAAAATRFAQHYVRVAQSPRTSG